MKNRGLNRFTPVCLDVRQNEKTLASVSSSERRRKEEGRVYFDKNEL